MPRFWFIRSSRLLLLPLRSSGILDARAWISFSQHFGRLQKILGGCIRRSSGSLDARAWTCVWCSSGVLYARADLFYISPWNHFLNHFSLFFSLSYFPKTDFWELLTLKPNFSLGFDLVGVIFYPWAFVKSVEIVKGYILIWRYWGFEHFEFLHHLPLNSEFEVGISYSFSWALSLNFSILMSWGLLGSFEKVWAFV